MSYAVFDAKGYVGDLASHGGWAAFVAWARGRKDDAALQALCKDGHVKAADLLADLDTATGAPIDVESTRVQLKKLAVVADEVVIVTDGVGHGEE